MDILQLRYFYEVSKSLHVTQTANALHVAQPALTQTIRRLEAELGVKLFRSEGRNIALTEYGQFLKGEIAPFLDVLDGIPGKLAELAEQNRSTVTVNVLAASEAVMRTIINFRRRHEDVKIRIIQNSEDRTADISVFTAASYRERPAGQDVCVFGEKIFLAVPDTGDFRNLTSVSLAEVKDFDFISLAGSKQLRAICDSFCAAAGFRPNIVFESDSPQTVREMIALQFGIGFWPQYSWGHVAAEQIRLLPITDPVCRRDIVVSWDLKAHRGNDAHVLSLKNRIVKDLEEQRDHSENA